MVEINEGTTGYLSATFNNKAGVAQIPTSANYRSDDNRWRRMVTIDEHGHVHDERRYWQVPRVPTAALP